MLVILKLSRLITRNLARLRVTYLELKKPMPSERALRVKYGATFEVDFSQPVR
jgi:hypothetical protein